MVDDTQRLNLSARCLETFMKLKRLKFDPRTVIFGAKVRNHEFQLIVIESIGTEMYWKNY